MLTSNVKCNLPFRNTLFDERKPSYGFCLLLSAYSRANNERIVVAEETEWVLSTRKLEFEPQLPIIHTLKGRH